VSRDVESCREEVEGSLTVNSIKIQICSDSNSRFNIFLRSEKKKRKAFPMLICVKLLWGHEKVKMNEKQNRKSSERTFLLIKNFFFVHRYRICRWSKKLANRFDDATSAALFGCLNSFFIESFA
jgi:hypothetical protein